MPVVWHIPSVSLNFRKVSFPGWCVLAVIHKITDCDDYYFGFVSFLGGLRGLGSPG